MKKKGYNIETRRQLFVFTLANLEGFPKRLELPSKYFGIFLACDAHFLSDRIIVDLADQLTTQGMVYLCAWGPDCERVHDLFDSVIVERNPYETEGNVVSTTWHTEDSLNKALWYFLEVAFPAEDYKEECETELVVVVGNDQWAANIEAYLDKQSESGDEDHQM